MRYICIQNEEHTPVAVLSFPDKCFTIEDLRREINVRVADALEQHFDNEVSFVNINASEESVYFRGTIRVEGGSGYDNDDFAEDLTFEETYLY